MKESSERGKDDGLRCDGCGAVLLSVWRLCPMCGRPKIALEDDRRRYLTVLFCDMVGSTELSNRLDEEAYQTLITRYHRICAEIVDECGGQVQQYLGDGVLSYFGYPVAREGEGEAVRAVRAALRTIEASKIENAKNELKAEIRIRAGIHTGPAVISGDARQRIAIGRTPNVAAGIQSLAGVDAVIVSADTARHIEGHFEVQPMKLSEVTGKGRERAKELEGLIGPEVFRVVRPTGARTKLDAAHGRLTPYVGRNAERQKLAAAWNEVRSGADRVVVVRGEAGIGKSRVVHDFRRALQREGGEVLELFCSPLTEATAFAPIIEELNRELAQRGARVSSASRLETLEGLLAERSDLGPDALPLIALLLSIPAADETAIDSLSPGRRRARTLEILHAWIASAASGAPLLLLVEDLHWADPSTLDLLDRIVRDSSRGQTLLLVTARPEFECKWTGPHVQPIDLGRLTQADVEAMATHVTGGLALPPEVCLGIFKRSEGVPLYVEEVTKTVMQSDALRRTPGGYVLVGELDEHVRPATLQQSLEARIDRLGESERVATYGAAIGREFSLPLIQAITNLGEDELRRHLDNLVSSELAFVENDPPSSRYRFKHALIQEAIYERPARGEPRKQIHKQILHALQMEPFKDLVEPEVIAHHAARAGEVQQAVLMYLEAGARAFNRTAVAEALKHLDAAHEILTISKKATGRPPGTIGWFFRLESDDKRAATERRLQELFGPAYVQIQIEVLRGPASMSTLGWGNERVLESTEALHQQAAEALASGKAKSPDEIQMLGERLYQAMWSRWTVYFLRGNLEKALEIARGVHEVAQGTGDPMLKVTGHHAIGYTHFYRGEYTEALRHVVEGLKDFDLDREKKLAQTFQFSSSAALLCLRSEGLQVLGRGREATQSFNEWLELIRDLGHAPTRAYSLCQQCYFLHVQDDVAGVRAFANEALSLSESEGFALWKPIAATFLAWADARQGKDPVAAVERIETAKMQIDRSGTHITEVELAWILAETLLLAGRPEEVTPTIEAALENTVRPGQLGHCESELYRMQGRAAQAMGDDARAAEFYRQALQRARDLGALLLELRAALALAELLGGAEECAVLQNVLNRLIASDQRDYQLAKQFLQKRHAARAASSATEGAQ